MKSEWHNNCSLLCMIIAYRKVLNSTNLRFSFERVCGHPTNVFISVFKLWNYVRKVNVWFKQCIRPSNYKIMWNNVNIGHLAGESICGMPNAFKLFGEILFWRLLRMNQTCKYFHWPIIKVPWCWQIKTVAAMILNGVFVLCCLCIIINHVISKTYQLNLGLILEGNR